MTKNGHVTKTSHMTTAEAARTLGVSVRTIHRMVAAGTLTAPIKLPGLRGAYLLDAAEVRRLADKGEAA